MAVVLRPKIREVVSEIPSGTVDGVNVTFSSSQAFVAGYTRLYLNGVRLKIGAGFDYVEASATTVVLSLAPKPDDHLVIDYYK